MRRQIIFVVLALSFALAACGPRSGESAEDYAKKVGTPAATPAAAATPDAEVPQAAPSGQQAVAYAKPYAQVDANSGVRRGLTINENGTFVLVENGRTTNGTYTWLPDGKRLKLNGVADRPIVLIANGAIYRLTNENVPIDDLTPDRMYSPTQ